MARLSLLLPLFFLFLFLTAKLWRAPRSPVKNICAFSFSTEAVASCPVRDENSTLSSGVTHLFSVFALLSICSFFFSPPSPLLPSTLCSLPLALTLTLSDSVSMLSRANPPLRGVKALQCTQQQTQHNVRTHVHVRARPHGSRKVSIHCSAHTNGIFYTYSSPTPNALYHI